VLPLAELDAEPLVEGAALEPPAADCSFFCTSVDAEPDAGPDGAVALPDGVVGVVVPEDAEPDGGVVRETARSPASLSQPVSNPAPSARDTATAKVESLMCGPPWLGYWKSQQGSGQCRWREIPGHFPR
jgi:hypothetical protein